MLEDDIKKINHRVRGLELESVAQKKRISQLENRCEDLKRIAREKEEYWKHYAAALTKQVNTLTKRVEAKNGPKN